VLDDILLELARFEREARARVRQKIASQQLGEAWVGLPQQKDAEEKPSAPRH
jgi:hypothetical protein